MLFTNENLRFPILGRKNILALEKNGGTGAPLVLTHPIA